MQRRFNLRCPDGSFEGPFPLAELIDRADKNRILPGTELSEDGATWIPADRLPQLKLDWMAELPNKKQYGPFSILALPRLIRTNTIPHDATILNRKTGQKLPAYQLLKSSTVPGKAEESLRQAKDTEWETRYHEEKVWRLQQETELAEMTDRLTQQLKEYETEIESLHKRIESEHNEHVAAHERALRQEEELQQSSAQCDELRGKLDAQQVSAAAKETDLAQKLLNETSTRESLLLQAQRRFDEQSEQLQTVHSTLEREREVSATQIKRLEEEATRMAARMDSEKKRLAEELAQQQELHLEFERRGEEQQQQLTSRLEDLQNTAISASSRAQEAESALARTKEEALLLADDNARLKGDFAGHRSQLDEQLRLAREEIDAQAAQLTQQTALIAGQDKSAAQRNNASTRENEAIRRELEQTREQSEALRNQLELHKTQARSSADQAGARENELREQLRKLESDAHNHTATLRHANTEVARLTKREKELSQRLHLVESRLTSASTAALASTSEHAEDAELKKRAEESATLINELRRKLADQMTARERIQQEMAQREAAAVAREDALKLEVERARHAADSARKDCEAGAAVRSELENTVQVETETLRKRMAKLEEANGVLQRDLTTARSDLDHARNSAAETTAELRMTRKQCQVLKGEKAALATPGHKPSQTADNNRARMQYAGAGVLAVVVFLIGISVGRLHVQPSEELPVLESVSVPSVAPEQDLSLAPGPDDTLSPPPTMTHASGSPALTPAPSFTPPDLTMEDVTVTADPRDNTVTVVFNSGIFSRFVELTPRAKQLLGKIGSRVAGVIPPYALHVEGHTDNVPLSSSAPYPNNRELGLARAIAVIKFLKSECKLPARSLIAVSSGDSRAPYENDTIEGRARNRTVVLKLVPTRSGGR